MGLLGNDWLAQILWWGLWDPMWEREREREREHYMGVDYGLKGVLGGCLVTSILMC